MNLQSWSKTLDASKLSAEVARMLPRRWDLAAAMCSCLHFR